MANQNKNTGGCYILLLISVLKVSNSYNIGASAAVLVTKQRRSGRTTAERLALIGCRNDVINYTANQYCGQLALPRLCSCVGHRPTRILEMNLNYFGTFLCTLNLHASLRKSKAFDTKHRMPDSTQLAISHQKVCQGLQMQRSRKMQISRGHQISQPIAAGVCNRTNQNLDCIQTSA